MATSAELSGHGRRRSGPITREGEVELARRFERGEILVLEAIVASGLDIRAALLSDTVSEETETVPHSTLTPGRREIVSAYVDRLEAMSQNTYSRRERIPALRPLIEHRELTRSLVSSVIRAKTRGEPKVRLDPRLRVGLAWSDAARDELVRSNHGIVAHISRKFLRRGLSEQDLMQEGYIGLLRAIDKFDYRLGHRFFVYAAWWIRSRITRAIAYNGMTIRVPSHVLETQRKLKVAKRALHIGDGSIDDEQRLARFLDISEERVHECLNVVSQPMSFEMKRDPVGDSDLTIGGAIADTNARPPDDVVADKEAAYRVLSLMTKLKPREQEILRLRFGIGTNQDHTLQELGDRYGVSRERARQIERAALEKLKTALASIWEVRQNRKTASA